MQAGRGPSRRRCLDLGRPGFRLSSVSPQAVGFCGGSAPLSRPRLSGSGCVSPGAPPSHASGLEHSGFCPGRASAGLSAELSPSHRVCFPVPCQDTREDHPGLHVLTAGAAPGDGGLSDVPSGQMCVKPEESGFFSPVKIAEGNTQFWLSNVASFGIPPLRIFRACPVDTFSSK